jgi:tetratricopeptide (TPR) repeat protein
MLMLAQAYYILGEITGEKSYFTESQNQYKALLESQGITPASTADIYSSLGHSFLSDGNPVEAKEYFIKSMAIVNKEITKVFLVKAYLNLQELDEAEKTLSQINISTMNEREKYDYAITWSILALSTKKADLLSKAKSLLNEAIADGPFFADIKHSLLSEVQRVINGGSGGKILKFISRYLHLQPNLFGLGVNINNILEDAGKKIDENKAR